ncbi:Hypothetical protein A7982_08215 [Minicystis rosea]|nr:Hypothetical protein A7982_08215 [Minicystis rosea]
MSRLAHSTTMNRDEIVHALRRLPPGQFDALLHALHIPTGCLKGGVVSPAMRIVCLVGWAEQKQRLPELERALQGVVSMPPQQRGFEAPSRESSVGVTRSRARSPERSAEVFACPSCHRTGSLREVPGPQGDIDTFSDAAWFVAGAPALLVALLFHALPGFMGWPSWSGLSAVAVFLVAWMLIAQSLMLSYQWFVMERWLACSACRTRFKEDER